MSDTSVSVGHVKTFIDKGTQCKLYDISPCEQSEGIKVSSNDRYTTNLTGDVHEVSIGNIFERKKEDFSINRSHVENILNEKVENSASKENAHMIIHSHYDTKICIKIPEVKNYGPTFQLDPLATKEILSQNPEFLVKILQGINGLSLSKFGTKNDQQCDPDDIILCGNKKETMCVDDNNQLTNVKHEKDMETLEATTERSTSRKRSHEKKKSVKSGIWSSIDKLRKSRNHGKESKSVISSKDTGANKHISEIDELNLHILSGAGTKYGTGYKLRDRSWTYYHTVNWASNRNQEKKRRCSDNFECYSNATRMQYISYTKRFS
jgi:hypothetical protein